MAHLSANHLPEGTPIQSALEQLQPQAESEDVQLGQAPLVHKVSQTWHQGAL